MRRPLAFAVLVFTAAVFLVLQLHPVEFPDYTSCSGQEAQIEGTVRDCTVKTARDGASSLMLSVADVDFTAFPPDNGVREDKGARVLVQIPCGSVEEAKTDSGRYLPGCRVRVHGSVYAFEAASNYGGFDALLYYRTLGYAFRMVRCRAELLPDKDAGRTAGGQIVRALAKIRGALSDVLDRCLPAEDAAILRAMLLGGKGTLPAQTKDLYQSAGIIHILAISGLHVALLGMGLYRLLRRSGLPSAACSALPMAVMVLYGFMTGMGESAARAIVMFLLQMTGRLLHRTYDLLTALSVAALLLVVSNPLLLYSTGFLFSFGSVLGIGAVLPSLGTKSGRILAVPAVTLPVYYACCYSFPVWSVVLNLVVLPLMSVVMGSGLLVLALGLVSTGMGMLAGLPCRFLLLFYRAIATAAQHIPGHAGIAGKPGAWQIAVYAALLTAMVLLREKLPALVKDLWIMAAMLLLTVRTASGLNLHVLDVGQGDGIFLSCDVAGRQGVRILVDGGSTSEEELARYTLEPFLRYQDAADIDYAILTHEDEDHLSGLLELIRQQDETGIRIRCLVLPDIDPASQGENYRLLKRTALECGTAVRTIAEGGRITYHASGRPVLSVICLHPEKGERDPEPNGYSTTLLVTYGQFRALLTGDLEGEGESRCLARMRQRPDLFPCLAAGKAEDITVLKVAHHGSSGATSDEFLAAVSPEVSLISCGRNNRYHHPHEETLRRLNKAGSRIYDTRSGALRVQSDGQHFRLWQVRAGK